MRHAVCRTRLEKKTEGKKARKKHASGEKNRTKKREKKQNTLQAEERGVACELDRRFPESGADGERGGQAGGWSTRRT
eukprot:2579303-Rhodomonas_salina.2